MTLPFVNNPEFNGTVTVACSVKFGLRNVIWQYSTICHDVVLGDDVVIGSGVWIGKGTTIGNGTRIQHGAFVPNNTRIGERVFIGPNVTLTDDKYPKARQPYIPQPPVLEDECSLGAGCSVLPGVVIGCGATVGAGAVVTNNVSPFSTVFGVPATERLATY